MRTPGDGIVYQFTQSPLGDDGLCQSFTLSFDAIPTGRTNDPGALQLAAISFLTHANPVDPGVYDTELLSVTLWNGNISHPAPPPAPPAAPWPDIPVSPASSVYVAIEKLEAGENETLLVHTSAGPPFTVTDPGLQALVCAMFCRSVTYPTFYPDSSNTVQGVECAI